MRKTIEQQFAVSEIVNNRIDGATVPAPTLAEKFEHEINSRLRAGYTLHSFEFHRIRYPIDGGDRSGINEKIMAVFVRST